MPAQTHADFTMNEPRDIEKTPYQSVQQVDHDGSLPPIPVNKKRTHLEKLGKYNTWVLTLGTIVILGCCAFLLYVWIVSINFHENETTSRLWWSIVRRSWTSRVVTLTTVLMRVSVGAQLTVFAALMAAVILEQIGASAEDLPLLSMIRCANTGPQALIWNVLHTISKRAQLGYSLLIIVTILNGLVLQFTSTILLADFGGTTVALSETFLVRWGVNATNSPLEGDLLSLSTDYWKSTLSTQPPFAEHRVNNASHGSAFDDTGKIYRGFIPFPNDTFRENLRGYAGPMTVVDERVLCIKPTLSNAVYHIPAFADDFMTAKLDFNDTHADAIQVGKDIQFNCTMPHFWAQKDPRFWYASICQLDLGLAHLRGGIKQENTTIPWLFFNVTTPKGFDWLSTVSDESQTVELPLRQQDSPDGAWSQINHPNMTVDVSLCLLNPQQDIYEVVVKGAQYSYAADSSVLWDPFDRRYFTLFAREQLDVATKEDSRAFWGSAYDGVPQAQMRGTLDLNSPEEWKNKRMAATVNESTWDPLHGILNKVKPWDYTGPTNDSFIITPKAGTQDSIHRYHLWIMQDILNSTNSPAKALQAVSHNIYAAAYYDWFTNNDLYANATCTTKEPRSFPEGSKHFKIVGGLLALHFALIVIALVLFFIKTEMSLLGNAWQAVSQVISDDTAAAVRHGTTSTDDEVLRTVKRTGIASSHVLIKRSSLTGRLEAVAINSPNR